MILSIITFCTIFQNSQILTILESDVSSGNSLNDWLQTPSERCFGFITPRMKSKNIPLCIVGEKKKKSQQEMKMALFCVEQPMILRENMDAITTFRELLTKRKSKKTKRLICECQCIFPVVCCVVYIFCSVWRVFAKLQFQY